MKKSTVALFFGAVAIATAALSTLLTRAGERAHKADIERLHTESNRVADEAAGRSSAPIPVRLLPAAVDDYQDTTPDWVEPDAPADIWADDTEPIILGDSAENGEISKKSDEFRSIVHEAYGAAMADPEFTLVLFGKTFGVGARGTKITQNGMDGRSYNTDEIGSIRNKLIENASEAGEKEQ